MAELSGLFGVLDRLKWENPITYTQAFLEATGDGPADGRSFWPAVREELDNSGITLGGVMKQEAIDILAGATKRQLDAMPPKQRLRELLTQNRAAIMAAMPKHMNPDRLLRVAQTACTSTPQLLECYVPSLLGGIMQAAQFGLEPNTPMGHCYLVPFRRNLAKRGERPRHRQDAQLIIGYRGLIDLARRSGQIVSIAAHDVREGDFFEYEYGLEEKLRHRPAASQRGELVHFYAVAQLVGGGHAMEVMSLDEVRAVMLGTQSGGRYGPWKDHFVEMGRKSAIRRLAKYLPMSVELSQAASGDSSSAELGPDGVIDSVVMDEIIDDAPAEQEATTEPPQQERASWANPNLKGLDPEKHPTEVAEETQRPAPQPNIPPDSHNWPVSTDDGAGGSVWVDSTGERFDPDRHATARDGRPAVVGGGRFRARRGAAKDPSPPVPARPAGGGGNGGAAGGYGGPSVDHVMKMIRENVVDADGVADVQAILADMPGTLLGKEQCVAALERAAAKIAGA